MKAAPTSKPIALAIGAALLCSVPALAAPQANKITARANTVVVPVVVTDKEGKHITGLTQDAFQVKENGQLQKVATFEEITASTTPVSKLQLPPNRFTNTFDAGSPKTLTVIALDLINTPFTNQADAKKALIGFLLHMVDPNTLVSMFVLEPNHVQMIHNFTSDPNVLIAALKKVQARMSSAEPDMNEDLTNEADVEAALLERLVGGAAALSDTSAVGNEAARNALSRAAAGRAMVNASFQNQAAKVTLEELEQIAAYLADVPGRKSLIWASSGFKLSNDAMAGILRGVDAEANQAAVRHLQEANVSIYPIDVTGLWASSAPGGNIAFSMPTGNNSAEGNVNARSAAMEGFEAGLMEDPIAAKHQTMAYMANATGGEAYYNQNDLEKLLRSAVNDSSQYYLLTYNTSEKGKEAWRKLEVKVSGGSYKVRSRSGFFYSNTPKDEDRIRQAQEILAVSSALNFSSLPLMGTWLPVEGAGEKKKVPFTLQLAPGNVAIDKDHDNHINLDFIAIASGPDGKEAARMTQRLDRTLPPAGASQVESSGLTYANSLNLAPGQYTVHLVVRDNQSGRIGSVVTSLRVP
jgi:VWFA-related protein